MPFVFRPSFIPTAVQQLDHGNAEQRIVIVGSQAETAFDVSEGALEITQGIACPGPVRQRVSLQPDIRIEGSRTVEALDHPNSIAALGREPPAEMSLRHGRADRDRGVIGCRGLFQPSKEKHELPPLLWTSTKSLPRRSPGRTGDGVFCRPSAARMLPALACASARSGLSAMARSSFVNARSRRPAASIAAAC